MTDLKRQNIRIIWLLFAVSFLSIVMLWMYSRPLHLKWGNVPPAPSTTAAFALSLGDNQLAYRFLGLILQSFGNTSGRYMSLKEYNYDTLNDWFTLLDGIDENSEFLPFLVAYYFGATTEKDKLEVVNNFLEKVGTRVGFKKWRWLTQAVYIARYRMKDMDRARELAAELANHDDANVAVWARNLDSFILEAMGEKEAAINMSLLLLKNNAQDMTQQEIYFLTDYICSDLMDEAQRNTLEMCNELKEQK